MILQFKFDQFYRLSYLSTSLVVVHVFLICLNFTEEEKKKCRTPLFNLLVIPTKNLVCICDLVINILTV